MTPATASLILLIGGACLVVAGVFVLAGFGWALLVAGCAAIAGELLVPTPRRRRETVR